MVAPPGARVTVDDGVHVRAVHRLFFFQEADEAVEGIGGAWREDRSPAVQPLAVTGRLLGRSSRWVSSAWGRAPAPSPPR